MQQTRTVREDSHFVIRVSSVNYMQVLSALQAGGSFWYPLNGCYQVVDDLTPAGRLGSLLRTSPVTGTPMLTM